MVNTHVSIVFQNAWVDVLSYLLQFSPKSVCYHEYNAKSDNEKIMKQIKSLEKKNFPKHESMLLLFDSYLLKRGVHLIYALSMASEEEEVVVIGYVILETSSGYLSKLLVDHDYRRQGIGKELIRMVQDRCTKMRIAEMTLHVSLEREGAISLYKACGFKQGKLVRDYYTPGRDALIFKWVCASL